MRKALADIPVGKEISDKENSYDHILSPEHRQKGYSLNVLNDNGKLFSVLKHKGQAIGNVYGSHHGSDTLDLSSGFASHITPEHQNKGLGKAMYEALFAHAKNGMGISKVVGGKHSTGASKVHSALAAKHGLGYVPEPNPEASMSDEEYNKKVPSSLSAFTSNVKYGPYSYTLKSEKAIECIGSIAVLSKSFNKSLTINQNKKSEHIWRTRPILKSKDAADLDQSTAAYAIKLGDIKRAEDTATMSCHANVQLPSGSTVKAIPLAPIETSVVDGGLTYIGYKLQALDHTLSPVDVDMEIKIEKH